MDDNKLKEMVANGADASAFKTSNLGKFLIELAKQSKSVATDKLLGTNPNNTSEIMALQIEALAPGLFLKWLDEAIKEGERCQFQLENRKSISVTY